MEINPRALFFFFLVFRSKKGCSVDCYTDVPFRYWMLDASKVYTGGSNAWDTAVHDASEEYKHRMVKGICVYFCVLSLSARSQMDLS